MQHLAVFYNKFDNHPDRSIGLILTFPSSVNYRQKKQLTI